MLNAEGFQKQTHVNCRVRKVHWSGHFGPSQANVEIKQTSPEGHVFYFNEKKHVIFVGPVLKVTNQTTPYPRQHIAVYTKNYSATQRQAKAAIAFVLKVKLENDFTLEPTVTAHNPFIHLHRLCKTSFPQSTVRKARWSGHFGPGQMHIEKTSPEGQSFEFKNKTYTIFVSPIQSADNQTPYPRQHVAIYTKNHIMTKGQAKAAISFVLKVTLGDDFILCPMVTTHKLFIDRFWKTSLPPGQKQKLWECVRELETEGIYPYPDTLLTTLRKKEGVSYKPLINKISARSFTTREVNISDPIIHDENFKNTIKMTALFTRIINDAIQANGYITVHKKFKNLTDSEMTLAVALIAILPMLIKRSEHADDNIPALYLYGATGTGKSFFFFTNPRYKRVGADPREPSRYELKAHEHAYLFDDIRSGQLETDYAWRVRQLALGDPTPTEINGHQKNVRAFVVCTSLHTPYFLKDDPAESAYFEAWKRRVIALKLTTPVYERTAYARFELKSATDALKCLFVFYYNLLETEEMKNMFRQYYLAINDRLCPDLFKSFKTLSSYLPTCIQKTN
jgi:hypothetical protein